ncbi:FadR family transcriptional regulator [Paenibacillus sp. J5C_2022]|uniref:FadR/GntR family transcriptional regulator n=1 Tax=Paenibacillus sp. J5C2022 TaxID=2977129 RepID=UPI0021D2D020|nr:FadR/GntR family transcriptional regulator [Paenibacillus sp. J5C2022]MCU6712624.1 FadR family transcriptional regulator [Paenibacillus sp. J5C2022]
MEPSEKVNLSHIVSERIKAYITENGLSEGDRLPSEKQLIDGLGVSRTVVREALKSLEMLGIVKIRTGDGIYVSSLSLKPVLDQVSFRWHQSERKMHELLSTRRVLELGAVEMAIDRYDISLINEMDACNRAMMEKVDRGLSPLEEDLAFHEALFRATGNETYGELSALISDFFLEIRLHHFANVDVSRQSILEHGRIVDAIKARDVARAKQEMELHLEPLKKHM